MRAKKRLTNDDVYNMVNERMLKMLDEGVIPWQKTWADGSMGLPRNLITNNEYRGLNTWMLACSPYSSPYWLSYKQARECKGYVRKDEKGCIVIFWKVIERKSKDPNAEKETERIFLLRYYTVFNTEQCEGLSHKRIKEMQELNAGLDNDHDSIAECETIVTSMINPPTIKHTNVNRAFYRPSTDTVNTPPITRFESPEAYYCTMFHELTHSTGHESRLNREGVAGMQGRGTDNYSFEELVAEMGAAYLCGIAGIENVTIENSAAYIAGWKSKLSDPDNKKWLVSAGSKAQKAVDHILGTDISLEDAWARYRS